MKINIYIPDKIYCIADKKLIYYRTGIPFSIKNSASLRENDINDFNNCNNFSNISKEINIDIVKRKINEIYKSCIKLFDPIIYYNIFDIKELPHFIIPSCFENVRKITIFISTLGKKVDHYIEKLYSENKTFESFIVDSCASESIESLNRHFDFLLRKNIKFNGTRRFSPGYGNIDVKINKFIVESYFKKTDIKVLDSGQLMPRKSTICLIGWQNNFHKEGFHE